MTVRSLIILAMLFTIIGCSPGERTSGTNASVEDWLPMKVGEVEFSTQIAINSEEQRKGLMHRDGLAPDSGMLFPYPAPRQLAFWMKNTRIPLDIGFFDGTGLLLEVHRMLPFDTNRTRSNSHEIQFALEMSSGWFAANGVFPGQRLDMDLLGKALSARGVDTRQYGISR